MLHQVVIAAGQAKDKQGKRDGGQRSGGPRRSDQGSPAMPRARAPRWILSRDISRLVPMSRASSTGRLAPGIRVMLLICQPAERR